MNTPSLSRRRAASAFTLIELLTVMAIIVILAGLIIGVASAAQKKAAKSRAQAEIKALESAINSYLVDNGTVPRLDGVTENLDAIDARKSAAGTGFPDASYQKSALFLFRSLSGYYDMSDPVNPKVSSSQKVYYPFKGNQLSPAAAANSNGTIKPESVTYIVDPFGLSYGYSTSGAREIEDNVKANKPDAQTKGYNPTFDLWSTAGYGGGKSYPTPKPTDVSIFWITNWSSQ